MKYFIMLVGIIIFLSIGISASEIGSESEWKDKGMKKGSITFAPKFAGFKTEAKIIFINSDLIALEARQREAFSVKIGEEYVLPVFYSPALKSYHHIMTLKIVSNDMEGVHGEYVKEIEIPGGFIKDKTSKFKLGPFLSLSVDRSASLVPDCDDLY